RASGRHGPSRRCADVPPGPRARAGRRAPPAVHPVTAMTAKSRSLFDRELMLTAIGDAFRKLTPRHLERNPVMFVVAVGSLFTTLLAVAALVGPGTESAWFILAISLWLWFTVLFANFAEAMAEG